MGACSSANVSPDAGTDATVDVGVPPPDAREADVTACGPVDVSGYQPATMTTPNPPHAGKCTVQQAADYAQCQGAKNATLCQQFSNGMPGQMCRECVETQSTDPRWGVLVFTGTSGVFNIEGCVDDALGEVGLEKADAGSGSCGDLLFSLYGCEAAACKACSSSAYDTCVAAAVTPACKAYDTPVESTSGPCGILASDAVPQAVQNCYPSSKISDPTQREVDWLDRIVTFMCGS